MKPIRSLFVFLIGVLATLYLFNPTAGFVELLPDNLPLIGNLDEAGATALLLACLRYFGFDPIAFFQERRKKQAKDDVVIDVEPRG